MSRLSWEERRRRLLEKTHERVRTQRADLRRRGYRLLPTEARFAFLCGHEGCSKSFGHSGRHGEASDE